MEEIKKEFVPYELALKMRHLGFDEPCSGIHIEWENKEIETCLMFCAKQDNASMASDNGGVLAPTWQAAFKWFREKYNMKPCFDWHPTEKYRYCIYYSVNTYFQVCDFETHEEAELECLKKLIEIVESNLVSNQLYSEIETLIMMWNNDGTKTAGSLTRDIMKVINQNELL
jgi:hypothetical protein